jgi:hypothetical protein
MALVANDYIRAVGMRTGGTIPTMQVEKELATTWVQGAVIIGTSGYAVEGADGPTTGTILGVAAEAAVGTKTTALVVPAFPEVIFECRIATGDAGGTVNSAVAHRYTSGFGLALDATTTWYINIGDTTDQVVMITDLVDAAGTAWGKVRFSFVDSLWVGAATP